MDTLQNSLLNLLVHYKKLRVDEIVQKLHSQYSAGAIEQMLRYMAMQRKIEAVSGAYTLTGWFSSVYLQINMLENYSNAQKVMEAVCQRLWLGITTLDLSKQVQCDSKEISRCIKTMLQSNLIYQCNNCTKRVFWLKVITTERHILDIYSIYVFKGKHEIGIDDFQQVCRDIKQVYEGLHNVLQNEQLKEQQITELFNTSTFKANIALILKAMVFLAILKYNGGFYFLNSQFSYVEQPLLDRVKEQTQPKLVSEYDFYEQDVTMTRMQQMLFQVVKNGQLFVNQLFYGLYNTTKLQQTYITVLTSLYKCCLSLGREKTENQVVQCIKFDSDAFKTGCANEQLVGCIDKFYNILNSKQETKPLNENIQHITQVRQKSEDLSLVDRTQVMLSKVREENTRTKLKIINGLLCEHPILTMQSLVDYLNIQMFNAGQLSSFNPEKVQLLLDNFINHGIVKTMKVCDNDRLNNMHRSNVIIYLSSIEDDSQQLEQVKQELLSADNHNIDNPATDEGSVSLNNEEFDSQYYLGSQVEKSLYLYRRVVELFVKNKYHLSAQLQDLCVTPEILISKLTIMDLLKLFRQFNYVFKQELNKYINDQQLFTQLNQLQIATVQRIFSSRKYFGQVKQQLCLRLKQLAQHGVLREEKVESMVRNQIDVVNLSKQQRCQKGYRLLVSEIRVMIEGVSCDNTYDLDLYCAEKQEYMAYKAALLFVLGTQSCDIQGQHGRARRMVQQFRNTEVLRQYLQYLKYLVKDETRLAEKLRQGERDAIREVLYEVKEENEELFTAVQDQIRALRQKVLTKRQVRELYRRAAEWGASCRSSCPIDLGELHIEEYLPNLDLSEAQVLLFELMMLYLVPVAEIAGWKGPQLRKLSFVRSTGTERLLEIITEPDGQPRAAEEVRRERLRIALARRRTGRVEGPARQCDPALLAAAEHFRRAAVAYGECALGDAQGGVAAQLPAFNYAVSVHRGLQTHQRRFRFAIADLRLLRAYVKPSYGTMLVDSPGPNLRALAHRTQTIYNRFSRHAASSTDFLGYFLSREYLNMGQYGVSVRQPSCETISYQTLESSKVVYEQSAPVSCASASDIFALIARDVHVIDKARLATLHQQMGFDDISRQGIICQVRALVNGSHHRAGYRQKNFMDRLVARVQNDTLDSLILQLLRQPIEPESGADINEQRLQLVEESVIASSQLLAEISTSQPNSQMSQYIKSAAARDSQRPAGEQADTSTGNSRSQAKKQLYDDRLYEATKDVHLCALTSLCWEDTQFRQFLADKAKLSYQKPILYEEDLFSQAPPTTDHVELEQLLRQCSYFSQIFVDGKIGYVSQREDIIQHFGGILQIEEVIPLVYDGLLEFIRQKRVVKVRELIQSNQKMVSQVGLDQILRLINVLILDRQVIVRGRGGCLEPQLGSDYMETTLQCVVL